MLRRILLLTAVVSLVSLLHVQTTLPSGRQQDMDEELLSLYNNANDHRPRNIRTSRQALRHQQFRKLQFVHITKTGGTAIEGAAAKVGVSWGACHFQRNQNCANVQIVAPSLPLKPQFSNRTLEPWHTPHFWFEPNSIYTGDTFVVVRNPYDRVISEFYCQYFGYNRKTRLERKRLSFNRKTGRRNPLIERSRQLEGRRRRLGQVRIAKPENPNSLNRWIQKYLARGAEIKSAHLLPQHLYVFDDNGKQMVTHVLHYESLQRDFRNLMKRYNMRVVLPPKDPRAFERRNESSTRRMTIQDLTPRTIELINDVYDKDFELLGYHKLPVKDSERGHRSRS